MALNIELPLLRARRAIPSLVIGGIDVLADLQSQNIISFKYVDNTSDKADDLCISIADPQRTWMQKYSPKTKKGTECTASLRIENWSVPFDTRVFDCGIFYINEVHFKGPPNAIEIKAGSVPSNGVKATKKFKSWEGKDLRAIAGEIASQNNLTLFYDTQENPVTKRTEQTDKSDLEYLRDRCKEAKLSLKIHKKQLVVYSEEEYEAREPAFRLTFGQSNILDWDFVTKSDDTFQKCKVCYLDTDTGKLIEEECSDGEIVGTTNELRINEGIENEPDDPDVDPYSLGQAHVRSGLYDINNWSNESAANKGKGKGGKKNAKRKAKAKLREKNKKEKKSRLKVVGNIDYLSGLNCQLQGFGEMFDIKWFIESSCHEVAEGGYTTNLGLRIALKGY